MKQTEESIRQYGNKELKRHWLGRYILVVRLQGNFDKNISW